MRNINIGFLLLPILILGTIFPFLSGQCLLNDYIDLHIYGFILSSFITGILFLVFSFKKKTVFTGNYLNLSLLIISLYMLLHNLFTPLGTRLDALCIIAFITLFFLFQSDRDKHLKLIAILIIIICIGEAFYGIAQFFHLVRYRYVVKGSFDNPAGFAALLSMGVPFCFSLFSYSRTYKLIGFTALIILLIAIILSASRAGIISTIVVGVYYLFLRFKTLLISHKKTFISICFLMFSFLGTYLFFIKQDSATGRMLIWQNTCRMIADSPLPGSGKNSFQAGYMLYQADYFAENPESKYVLLADNVTRPFNEYLLFACEYGLIGLFLLLGVICIICRFLPPNFSSHFGAVIVLMVFSCFSYPLYYPVVLLIGAYSLAGISGFIPSIVNIRYTTLLKSILGMLLVGGIYVSLSSIRFELQWKEVVWLCSLGKGEEMLDDYEELHDKWNRNPYFLYNYGAQLNRLKRFEESNQVLHDCKKYFNDYDLQMLLADNYMNLGQWKEAEKHFIKAFYMCPVRFIPLQQLMNIYEQTEETEKVKYIAQKIIEKPVKISSYKVRMIKKQAEEKLKENILISN